MATWRKPLGVVTVSGALIGAAVLGVDLFHNAQFAQAEQQVTATRQQLATVQDQSALFRDIHKVVEPSVVEIRVTKTIPQSQSQIPPEFQRFFHDFGNGNGQFNLPPQAFGNNGPQHEVGTGSGVIMEAKDGYGYILTNNHVAGGASELVVTLSDGRIVRDTQVLGTDPKSDLAVVKIKADHLIPAAWGDSTQLEPGDEILAFGAPFGYVGSMTHGIVSALHRQTGILGNYGFEDFIQVDAPINPGNSGGPLVNLHGEVVGINTAIASSSGGFQGIGFAIPSAEAKSIYAHLKEGTAIARGWLGVEIANVADTYDQSASEGFKGDNGVLVHGVLRNSPAQHVLHPGDIVTKLDGKEIDDRTQLSEAIALDKPGTNVTLRVFRDGKMEDVNVKLGEQPNDLTSVASDNSNQEQHGTDELGVQLGTVNDELAQQYGLSEKNGAVVTAVAPNSPAAQAGIQEGDVITRVNHHRVDSPSQAEHELSLADLKSGVQLQVDNKQGSELIFIKPS